jgi:hypothetical protein
MNAVQLIVALWWMAGAWLHAQTTVAYDGFDYLKGGCLAGGATGSGWASAWGDTGESGDAQSELVLGPGSFPLPPGSWAATGHHVDLNRLTGLRRITRRMGATLGGGTALQEHAFSSALDFGPAQGIDYAGIELSHSSGSPIVFIGKPPGAGPSSPGSIGMDIYGQGFTSTGVAASGQKHLRLKWSPNPSGPETLTLIVSDAASGNVLGTTSQTAEFSLNQVTLVARRDLAAGGAIPAFDELRATTGTVETRTLSVVSVNPDSGVAISVAPADGNGAGDGSTSFERIYPVETSVTLSAPATSAGNGFSKWTLGGADYSTRRTITLTMTEHRALAAVFTTPPPPVRTITIASENPASGVPVTVSPNDMGGQASGSTPFSRSYADGSSITLTAPELPGKRFQVWKRDAMEWQTTSTATAILSGNHAFTAVYEDIFPEQIGSLTFQADGTEVRWPAIGGRSYVVEATSDLSEGFSAISDVIVANGNGWGTCSFKEPLFPPPPRRFYRLRIASP